MLEAAVHPAASFVTLTYNDKYKPLDGCVRPEVLSGFMKRLRYHVGNPGIRFYGVGEYGDKTWRPHYHLALFGIDPTLRTHCQYIEDAWKVARGVDAGNSLGFTYTGSLTVASAQYIAKYVTKKMTNEKDPRLCGRAPEFARMSLRPGIGALSVSQIAAALQNFGGLSGLDGDVPKVLTHGRTNWPLGRYMRARMRLAMGMHPGEPEDVTYRKTAELLNVYKDYLNDAELAEETGPSGRLTTKGYLLATARKRAIETHKMVSMEYRQKIYGKEKL